MNADQGTKINKLNDIAHKPRRLTVLGSTGSIGCNTLDLVTHASGQFEIEALTAFRNVADLAAQARKHKAELAVIADESLYDDLKSALSGSNVKVAAGASGLIEAAERAADLVMTGIVGAAGLPPTLAAIRQGTTVAVANKEPLVCAGQFVMSEVKRHGATLLPVDSEHNAIFQVLDANRPEGIEKIILTASGGPLRNLPCGQMANVTPEQAVAHPNWDMGAKISVDSATMMNKGLELIEAHHLFNMGEERIDILVHPESVIHSMVAYIDGSVLAQLGSPDMRTPIAYALAWPDRLDAPVERLDLAKLGQLTFEKPDPDRFPALRLAREALRSGGAAPTVLNAANEVAVEEFLRGRLSFPGIAATVEETLTKLDYNGVDSLEDVFEVDRSARDYAHAAGKRQKTR